MLAALLLTVPFATPAFAAAGDLDPSFSGDGKLTTNFGGIASTRDLGADVAIQTDGKIVVAGTVTTRSGGEDFALARYNADGGWTQPSAATARPS